VKPRAAQPAAQPTDEEARRRRGRQPIPSLAHTDPFIDPDKTRATLDPKSDDAMNSVATVGARELSRLRHQAAQRGGDPGMRCR
jgi:hypothetical protein